MKFPVLIASSTAIVAACSSEDYQQLPKTAITNAYVWRGKGFSDHLETVVICGGKISNANPYGATVIDAQGGYLIPGLIDTHCHVQKCSYLTSLRQYGVTTAFDMGTYPRSFLTTCKAPGVTDVYGPGAAATVNGTTISRFPGLPADSLVPNMTAGQQFVANRIAQGADYIKVILDPLGPTDEVLSAIIEAAHDAGKMVVTHAPQHLVYVQAEVTGADLPCHVPLDAPLNTTDVSMLDRRRAVVCPTLIMMQSIVNNTHQPYSHYTRNAEASVTNMYAGGVPLIVGSDANLSPYTPANPPFGLSLHQELELLVAAGVSPLDAIRGATDRAAQTFKLYDRGHIKTGFRADLVLLRANPLASISNSQSIERVWVEGIEANLTAF